MKKIKIFQIIPFQFHFNFISIPNNSNENFEIKKSIDINDKNFLCGFCLKFYSSNSNLTKHTKVCKIKKENDEEKENIFKLLLEKDKENKEKINHLEEQNKLLMDKIYYF